LRRGSARRAFSEHASRASTESKSDVRLTRPNSSALTTAYFLPLMLNERKGSVISTPPKYSVSALRGVSE
jgi:hypothetical protein